MKVIMSVLWLIIVGLYALIIFGILCGSLYPFVNCPPLILGAISLMVSLIHILIWTKKGKLSD